MDCSKYKVKPGTRVKLDKLDPSHTGRYKDKKAARTQIAKDIKRMSERQDVLYADAKYSLLIIFQAMDAAGKDSAIKHVMSGINPQGCRVTSFKAPSDTELSHDYLWRCSRALPPRGCIGIFNRSYYEEVLVARVHENILENQNLPEECLGKNIWANRYEDINSFERYLARNGTKILKFFLHISREEQRQRFLKRINRQEKNWKFSSSDAKERQHWDKYMRAYEQAFEHTSTQHAPWYIVPADNKWYSRTVVAQIVADTLDKLPIEYPELEKDHYKILEQAKTMLENE